TDFNPDYFVQGENSFRRCNFDSSTQLDSNIFSTFLRLDANDPSSPDNWTNYGIRSAQNSTHTIEIVGRANSGNLYFGGLDNVRQPWRKIWHSGNFNPEPQSSDIRFKTDIDSIHDPLKKVNALKGISFNWKHSDFPDRHFPQGRQIGVIAQEVEKILPEVIRTDKDGYKSVAYDKLSAILIEAVKEQQKIIENQNEEIEKHEDKIAYQKTEIDSIKNGFKELEKIIYTIKSNMEKK
ncbi:MAG TPA: tail fiber domain-containing protein, partial [Chitinispirillaceae bacterium]|nr:tail fiber domain-containing protein [Chitinispirillaceae bacterium]